MFVFINVVQRGGGGFCDMSIQNSLQMSRRASHVHRISRFWALCFIEQSHFLLQVFAASQTCGRVPDESRRQTTYVLMTRHVAYFHILNPSKLYVHLLQIAMRISIIAKEKSA